MSAIKSTFTAALVALVVIPASKTPAQSEANRNPIFMVRNAPAPAAPRARFAILGDRTGGHVAGLYEEAVAEVARLQPDFVLTVGDQIEGYTEDTATLVNQWQEYFSIINPLSAPVYLTPGNHDITTDGMLPMFRRFVGEPYHSFDIGNLHFVILDNSRWESSAQLPDDQLKWLTSDLAAAAKAKFTFVFFHKPFWYNSLAYGKPDTLHALFVRYGVDAVFAGHFHRYFSGTYNGIKYTGVGTSGAEIDGDPTGMGHHFMWVTVDTAIEIAPIKVGSVMPWNEVTISELHGIDSIEQTAVSFVEAVGVNETKPIETLTVHVSVSNFASDATISDSIRWEVSNGWNIHPFSAELAIPPGGKRAVEFLAVRTGDLFPVPKLSVKLPFHSGRTVTVTKDLAIARQADCRRVSRPPVIDGQLTDDIWQRPISRLYNSDSSQIDSAYFYFAYDKSNLYVAVHCREPRMDSLVAAITERDGAIYGEDCIGFFFQPDYHKDTVYQIYFSPLGTVFDQKISQTTTGYYDGDRSWNGSYDVKTTRSKDGWNVEARIPLAQFGISAKSGDSWGLNFRRKQKRLNSGAEWQTPVDYNPRTFGVLKFQ